MLIGGKLMHLGAGALRSTATNRRLMSSHTTSESRKIWFLVRDVQKLNHDDAIAMIRKTAHSHAAAVPRSIDLNRLLGAIAGTKRYGLVLAMYREMESLGVSPNVYSLNVVIGGLCSSGETELALATLGNLITLNTLVHGLCLQGDVHGAVKAVEDGVETDGFTYGPILNRVCKAGNSTLALKLLRYMEERNVDVNQVKYTIVMDCLYQEMETKGMRVDIEAYTCLVRGLLSAGREEESKEILEDMIIKKIPFDLVFWNTFIDGLVKNRNLKDAGVMLTETMVKIGMKPNVVTYNTVMNGYCKKGLLNEAREMMEAMVTGGCDPSIVTYNILIKGYCKSGMVDAGLKLFHDISQQGVVADTATYNTLIHGLCQSGKFDDAKNILREMLSRGVAPDVRTAGTLLDALCEDGRLEEALKVFERFKSEMVFGIGIYNIIMKGMCNSDKVDDAWDIFTTLPLKRLEADVTTYSILISGFCKKGSMSKADMLFKEMKAGGHQPNRWTYIQCTHQGVSARR